MRRIGVVTLSRSEYSILRPVLKRIIADPDLQLVLYVGGMHLSPDFGNTVTEIEYPIAARIECLMSSDSPEGMGKSIGLTAMGFAQAFANDKPDILLVTGDRYEMFAATAAAVPFGIPIAHLDGGAITYGALDEQWRHAMTKLAHLHFCYIEENAMRVKQMGEEAWRVTVTGNPSLDDIHPDRIWTNLAKNNIHVTGDTLLVVFHSVTTEYEHTEEYIDNLLKALLRINQPVIMIMPNSDMGGHIVIKAMRHFAEKYPKLAQCHANLWPDVFRGVMAYCGAMVGNSSAGIMEAPSFHLPVVNIGTRQAGRMHARNVIDVGYSTDDIVTGIEVALAASLNHELDDLVNPYGDGHAAERIISVLKTMPINEALLIKRFAEGEV